MKADLHMHSVHSDGTKTVKELVYYAKEKGLDVIALTDHDSVSGVSEAMALGKELGIKVIPGVELSTFTNDESIHVLGYFTRLPQELVEYSKNVISSRRKRIIQMADNCVRLHGLKYDKNRLMELSGVITRAHLIRELALSNPEYTKEEIANNFLLESKPAYIPSTKLSTVDGIKYLRSLGAKVVIAHPVLLEVNNINDVVKLDIDGLEAIYPKNKPGDEARFRKLCQENNLFITAGSDYHGVIDYSHGDLAFNVLEGKDLEIFLRELGE